jgi:hypothetical protein
MALPEKSKTYGYVEEGQPSKHTILGSAGTFWAKPVVIGVWRRSPIIERLLHTAQINEALRKVLYHNTCCLIQSMFELGLKPEAA